MRKQRYRKISYMISLFRSSFPSPFPPIPSSYQADSFHRLLTSLQTSCATGHQVDLLGPSLPGQSTCVGNTDLRASATASWCFSALLPPSAGLDSVLLLMWVSQHHFLCRVPCVSFKVILHGLYFSLARTRNHIHHIFSCFCYLLLKMLNFVLSFLSLVLNHFSSKSLLFHSIFSTAVSL